MRVDLRRRQIRMTEHRLDGAQVCSALQQMGREGVPQHVRAEGRPESGGQAVPAQDLPEAAPREAVTAARVHEEPRTVALLQEMRSALGDVAPHPRGSFLAEWHDALL